MCVQLAKMRPEEYRQIIKTLETHFEEFKVSCHGSQMFADEDKRTIENQFTGAQAHYDQLVVQLPAYSQYYKKYTALLMIKKNIYVTKDKMMDLLSVDIEYIELYHSLHPLLLDQ